MKKLSLLGGLFSYIINLNKNMEVNIWNLESQKNQT